MPVALPGTQDFDDVAIERRREQIAARRPRRALVGAVLMFIGAVAVVAYVWANIRPGSGALSLDAGAVLRTMPLSTPVVALVCSALAIVGTWVAVPRDAPHLSRAWIGGGLVVFILGTALLGTFVLAPMKWAREDHPVAAAERELEAKRVSPTPFCTAAIDPAPFTPWVDDPQMCGQSLPNNRELRIVGPTDLQQSSTYPQRGLIYSPDHEPQPWGGCIRRLDHDWWEYSSVINGVSCPSGLDHVPSG